MSYRISEWHKAGQDFQSVFKVSIRHFYDGFMTILYGCIQIDPFKFDDYLYKIWNYDGTGKSMQDVILEHYGQKGLDVFLALMPSKEATLNERIFKTAEAT